MRKTVISFALAPLFSSSLGAAADENPSDRIGSTSVSARTEAFRQGLRELGVEGKKALSLNGDVIREKSIAFPRSRLS